MAHATAPATFDLWLDDRELRSIGTNYGSRSVAFQGWQKFKEAFAPELILRATAECGRPVTTVLDPFGGSGTTGLASQFLGFESVSVEVNPYLADLIEAKLTAYDVESLRLEATAFVDALVELAGADERLPGLTSRFGALPKTFIEPGVNERWIFSRPLAGLVAGALDLADKAVHPSHQRLFRIVIGGTLISLSNVRVSGKGRRYRSGWSDREVSPRKAADQIIKAIERAVEDVEQFQPRQTTSYRLIRGDSREALRDVTGVDVAVFSPPYPNSFDYTDVYNVELWVLGYLANSKENRELRASTLASHVQVRREFLPAPKGSSTLDVALRDLEERRDQLWDRTIPAMVGAYFADMAGILSSVHSSLSVAGEVWMVVGDSRYSGVDVRVADVLVELAPQLGYDLILKEPFRSMRSSPQQGGAPELAESLVVLRKRVSD